MKISEISKKVERLKIQRQLSKESLKAKQSQIEELLHSLENYQMASAILLTIAKKTQSELAYRLSNLVSSCLSSVFEEPYEFVVSYVNKRGKTEVDFALLQDGMSFDNPILSVGGGVVDVVAFALRVACLCMATPQARRVLILDEPFHFLQGEEDKIRVGKLIGRLSKELDIQFVIISNLKRTRAIVEVLDAKVFEVIKGKVS
jgi:hypothetical protein